MRSSSFRTRSRRRGTVLPLMVVSIVALVGFVALAVDLGMLALARNQCQNVADASALTGARTLTGNAANENNIGNCEPAAKTAARANVVLNRPVTDAQVAIRTGSYTYDAASNTFVQRIPKAATDNWSLCESTVTYDPGYYAFGRIFGATTFNTSATATAVHRPRDVAIVLDYSGSMRFASLLGIPYSGTRDNPNSTGSGSNNPESVIPRFGPYVSSNAGLQLTSDSVISGNSYEVSNVTEANAANDTRPPIVSDFYQSNNSNPATAIKAFHNTSGTPQIPSDGSLDTDGFPTTNGGDKPLYQHNTTTFGMTARAITNGQNFNGYTNPPYTGYPGAAVAEFQGFTRGPRYWGKTFFIWPPDPRPANDWRKKFFYNAGTTATLSGHVNQKLFHDSGAGNSDTGTWLVPGTSTYRINYNAILNWIKNTGPNPFPPALYAGNIKYYDAIPDTIDTSLNFWTTPASPTQSYINQRFWKEYIDFALGVREDSSGSWSSVVNRTGYGSSFVWSTGGSGTSDPLRISITPSSGQGANYMDYRDNPRRPRTQFWFGGMTMVDFLGCYNQSRFWWAGTVHEAPLYAGKLGIRAALEDINTNHPNDLVSLIMFSVPKETSTSSARFNIVRAPLGRSYDYMINSLFYPQSTLALNGTENGTTLHPYHRELPEVPNAQGGTCYSMGLMLAYNQFAQTPTGDNTLRNYYPSSATVPEGMCGGLGRRGAQKLVIFETDGMPNNTATASLTNAGSYDYYRIRYNPNSAGSSQYPSVDSVSDNDSTVTNQINTIVQQLRTRYSTARKPMRLHTIAFGPFVANDNPGRAGALATLQTMQYYGNTQTSPSTPLESYKIVTGSDQTVISRLQTAVTAIMQGSIQVSLIE